MSHKLNEIKDFIERRQKVCEEQTELVQDPTIKYILALQNDRIRGLERKLITGFEADEKLIERSKNRDRSWE